MKDAMERCGVPAIANSDQGSQFTSEGYIARMASAGVRRSMDGKSRWMDNVVIERWFRSLKTEYVYINEYGSPRELRAGIAEYARAYNSRRPYQSLDYKTPEDVYLSAFATAEAA
jgi:putative transposase